MASSQHQEPVGGRVWGWLSGLGTVVAPWVIAGIVSTFTPNPEATFPWALLAGFLSMVAWIVYGSIRIPGFRRGAVRGSAIALGTAGVLVAVVWLASP